jgi:hypothetical protein
MRLQFPMTRVSCPVLVASMVLAGCLPMAAQNVTATPETGVTPSALLLYRADLLPGKEAAYEQAEAEIVRGYASAKIPVYWSALQSVTGTPHVLYFDGFDTFADIERAGADVAQGLDAHPEIGTLQQKLQDLISGMRTIMAFRRDDLGYRLNKIDLAKAHFVRVSILGFRAGYEDDFAEAVRARARMYETNDIDTPWMIYQVHSGLPLPTFIEFQPMNSLSEIDDALDRNKKGHHPGDARQLSSQKWIKEADLSIDIQVYSVSESMSHLSALNAPGRSLKRDGSAARVSKYIPRPWPGIESPGTKRRD